MSEIEMTVEITEPEADLEHLERTTSILSRDLQEIGASSVERLSTQAPAGAKSGESITIGLIALTIAASLIPNALDIFRAVTDRGEGRSITLKFSGGVEIILEAGDEISEAELAEIVERVTRSV